MSLDPSLPRNVHILTEREQKFVESFATGANPLTFNEFLEFWEGMTPVERHDLWSKHYDQ